MRTLKELLLTILIVMVASIIGSYMVFYYWDIGYPNVTNVNAQVIDKVHVKSYTTHTPVMVGKTMTLIANVHPEKYRVVFKYGHLKASVEDVNLYNALEVGDDIEVEYCKSASGKRSIIRYKEVDRE